MYPPFIVFLEVEQDKKKSFRAFRLTRERVGDKVF